MNLRTRSSRRALIRNLPSYLAVASADSVDELRAALELLPLCARGQVIVEVSAQEHVEQIDVPARVSVTLVRRRTEQLPGEAALARVRAWASEMVCGDARHSVWLAGDSLFSAPLRNALEQEFGVPAESFAEVAV